MIILLNPKPYLKRVSIYTSIQGIDLTVEFLNGMKKTQCNLGSIGAAKKYFGFHFLCEDKNLWTDESAIDSSSQFLIFLKNWFKKCN